VSSICPSKITGAFGAFRNVMVGFPVPLNVAELFNALICHTFPRNTATMYVDKEWVKHVRGSHL